MGRNGLKVEFQSREEAKGSLGADQDAGHVMAGRRHRIDVVAADPAQEFGYSGRNLVRFAGRDGPHTLDQRRVVRRTGETLEIAGGRPEAVRRTGRQHRLNGVHAVHHVAVADRPCPAAVVAGHASERGPASGGDIHGEEKAVWFQARVQLVEHEPGLDDRASTPDIDVEHPVEVFGGVDDERWTHGLAALRRAGPARQNRDPFLARDRQRCFDVSGVPGHDHPDRFNLVDRGIGGVPPAAEGVEQHVPFEHAAEARFQGAVADTRAGGYKTGHRVSRDPSRQVPTIGSNASVVARAGPAPSAMPIVLP